jgi:predicted DNA-binding transcriptional regulator AlpA
MDVLEKSYRRRSVEQLFDLKTSTLYDMIARGAFPKPDYHLGKLPLWNASTLERHRQALIARQTKRAR